MSNISGFSAMRKKQEAAGGSDSDEEERKKQELYAGGIDGRGGGSGMAVLGPSRARGRPTPPAAGDVFGRLVQSASQTNEGEYPPSSSGDPESMTITLYSNGFTVNDGPLRDPGGSTENQAFLDDILKGDVPSEIRRTRKDPTKPMTLSLSDKRKEAYKAPAYVAFSSGATLGSSSSSAVQGGASGFDPGSLPAVPVLDESQPSTTVQVRTIDGKKLKLKINLSITVSQFAALVASNSADTASSFSLSAGYPPKDLTDGDATVEAAGLKGAAVTQKNVV